MLHANHIPAPASGARRMTAAMFDHVRRANGFTGVPRGTAKPFLFLAAFQEAEPYLGLPVHAAKLVSWLSKTQPQDWEEGSRLDRLAAVTRRGGVSRPLEIQVKALSIAPCLKPVVLRCATIRKASAMAAARRKPIASSKPTASTSPLCPALR